MQFVNTAIGVVALGIIAWLVFEFARDFSAATGSTWDRLIAAGKGSATILWSRFCLLLGALSTFLSDAADYFGDPNLAEPIKNLLSNPKYVAIFMAGVAFITILARKRTMPKE